jgi:predicted DsbA family dithiol-disulfide isomerase
VAPSDLKQRAESLGLDGAAFADCLDSNRYKETVRASIAEGTKAGVRGTPSFFLSQTDPADPGKIKATKFIRGAQGYAAFKQAIDELLKPSS